MMSSNVQGSTQTDGIDRQNAYQSRTLTDEQKTTVESILSQYNANDLSKDDAKSILKSLHDAGVKPSADLTKTLKSAGFDAKKLRDLAGPPQGGPGGPGGPHKRPGSEDGSDSGSTSGSTSGVNVSSLKSLQSILNQYDLSNLSSSDQSDLMSKLNQSGLMNSGSTINIGA
jgi:hypothetical protein